MRHVTRPSAGYAALRARAGRNPRDTPAGFRPVGPHIAVVPAGQLVPAGEAELAALAALRAVAPVDDALLVLAATPDAGPALRDGLDWLARTAAERRASQLVLAASGLGGVTSGGRRPAEHIAAEAGLTVMAPDGVVSLHATGVLWVAGRGDGGRGGGGRGDGGRGDGGNGDGGNGDGGGAGGQPRGAWWMCPPHGTPAPLGPRWPLTSPVLRGGWTAEAVPAGLWLRPAAAAGGGAGAGPRSRLPDPAGPSLFVGAVSRPVPEEAWEHVPALAVRLAVAHGSRPRLLVLGEESGQTASIARVVCRLHDLDWGGFAPATAAPAEAVALTWARVATASRESADPAGPAGPAAAPESAGTAGTAAAPDPADPADPAGPAAAPESAGTAGTAAAPDPAGTAGIADPGTAGSAGTGEPAGIADPAASAGTADPAEPADSAGTADPAGTAGPAAAPEASESCGPLVSIEALGGVEFGRSAGAAAAPTATASWESAESAASAVAGAIGSAEGSAAPEPPTGEPLSGVAPSGAVSRVGASSAERMVDVTPDVGTPGSEPPSGPAPRGTAPSGEPPGAGVPAAGVASPAAPEPAGAVALSAVASSARVPDVGASGAEASTAARSVGEPPGGRPRLRTVPDGRAGGETAASWHRDVLRQVLGPDYVRLARRVDQVATRLPGLRSAWSDDVRVDLVAVLLYHLDAGRPAARADLLAAARAGRLDGMWPAFLACLTSGLRRLPSHQGCVLLGARIPSDADVYIPGTVTYERAAVCAAAAGDVALAAPVELAVWSVTGRRTAAFGAPGDEPEVVFPPGSRFRVLDVVKPPDDEGCLRVLLREAGPDTDRADEFDARALRRLRPLMEKRAAMLPDELRPVRHPERFHVAPGLG